MKTQQVLEQRLSLMLSLLEDQEKRGVERCTLMTLVKKIQEIQTDLNQLSSEVNHEPELESESPILFEDGDDPDKPLRHIRAGKWPVRKSIRKSGYLSVRAAHPKVLV